MQSRGALGAVTIFLFLMSCKKTAEPPSQPETMTLQVGLDGRCFLHKPEHCAPGDSCDQPPPIQIDCPPNAGDAASPRPTRRPPGKEDWVRAIPELVSFKGECTYSGEYFCAPPGKPPECTPMAASVKVSCTDPFVWKDALGGCHQTSAQGCSGSCALPEGEPVPCDAPVASAVPPPEKPWDLACVKDTDCVPVQGGAGCCNSPCPAGAINKSDLARVQKDMTDACNRAPRKAPCISAGGCRGHAILCLEKKCVVSYEGDPGFRKRVE
jgi:hypothetical protein